MPKLVFGMVNEHKNKVAHYQLSMDLGEPFAYRGEPTA